MHFSIPSCENLTDSKENTYTAYNLQINGVYHCSFRYSKLHDFNVQLKKEFNHSILSSFPSKKLLSLSSAQLEERRSALEKYIQNISQIPEIVSSDTFTLFFLNAQKESMRETDGEMEVEVGVPGSGSVMVCIKSSQQTRVVYQVVADKLNLSEACRAYFGLYLTLHKPDGHFTIIRRLQGFESPLISLKALQGVKASSSVAISIRKVYWDVEYDKELMSDKTSLSLLVALAKSDVANGWVRCGEEERTRLKQLLKQGAHKEYMRSVSMLPFYGHVVSEACYANFPLPDSLVSVALGGGEVRFLLEEKESDLRLKVTRIRCWRISSIPIENRSVLASRLGTGALELSMEYLMAKDSLRWISVYSTQAILMSMCLQSMVDELIVKRDGGSVGVKTNSTRSTDQLINKFTFNRLSEMDLQEQKYFSQNNAFDEIRDDDL